MKALTVLQPWATCIARHGKDIENRTWAPSPRTLPPGSLLAIHAAKQPGGPGEFVFAEELAGEVFEVPALPYAAVVAVVEFFGATGDVGSIDNPWAHGPVCWLLKHARPLSEPVPCRGAQGLWNLPPDVEARVLAQIA